MPLDLLMSDLDQIYQKLILEMRKFKHVFIPCAGDSPTLAA